MTTTVVAYTSFCDGHVTRFSSLRTSLRNRRMRSMRPPVASFIVSSVVVSAMSCYFNLQPSSLQSAFAATRLRRDSLRALMGGSPSRSALAGQAREGWQARRESNPQPPVLETGALPIELLAYSFLRVRLRLTRCGLHSLRPPPSLRSARGCLCLRRSRASRGLRSLRPSPSLRSARDCPYFDSVAHVPRGYLLSR